MTLLLSGIIFIVSTVNKHYETEKKLSENKNKKGRHDPPLAPEIKPGDKKKNEAALEQAGHAAVAAGLDP